MNKNRRHHKSFKPNTSWGKISGWYDKHLKSSDTYHEKVVIPRIIELIKEYGSDLNILDIACGQGILADNIAKSELRLNYTGFDISEELISIARQNNPNDSFFVANAEDFSNQLKANNFDLAVCILALQNIEKLAKVFEDTARILKIGGDFIFVITHPSFRIPKHSDWVEDTRQNKIYRGADIYMSTLKIPIQSKPFKSKLANARTETTYTFHRPLQDYIRLLGKAGFGVVDMEELISHKKSEEKNPKAKIENKSREEIPLFMLVKARKL